MRKSVTVCATNESDSSGDTDCGRRHGLVDPDFYPEEQRDWLYRSERILVKLKSRPLFLGTKKKKEKKAFLTSQGVEGVSFQLRKFIRG
jgi:hypothetical protein